MDPHMLQKEFESLKPGDIVRYRADHNLKSLANKKAEYIGNRLFVVEQQTPDIGVILTRDWDRMFKTPICPFQKSTKGAGLFGHWRENVFNLALFVKLMKFAKLFRMKLAVPAVQSVHTLYNMQNRT